MQTAWHAIMCTYMLIANDTYYGIQEYIMPANDMVRISEHI